MSLKLFMIDFVLLIWTPNEILEINHFWDPIEIRILANDLISLLMSKSLTMLPMC